MRANIRYGYEYEEEQAQEMTPRLDLSEIVFSDTFGAPYESKIEETDKEVDECTTAADVDTLWQVFVGDMITLQLLGTIVSN